MNTQRKKILASIMIGVLFGIIIGYMLGMYITIKGVVSVASNFIEVDYQMVEQAITQYKNHIGACYNGSG